MKFSDFIIYVDESGDHSLTSIDKSYPVFVLTFCVFEKNKYTYHIAPSFRLLKFSTFGHDMVIFHERDIRKKLGIFSQMGREKRELFFYQITNLISQTDFILISAVIDKYQLKQKNVKDTHVYHLAMQLCLEKLFLFLQTKNEMNLRTHVICEARGKTEDQALELEFVRVCSGQNSLKTSFPFELVIADKKTNSEGLQFADLAARPVGLSVVRPHQSNRAFEIFKRKFYRNAEGTINGHGLYLYPNLI